MRATSLAAFLLASLMAACAPTAQEAPTPDSGPAPGETTTVTDPDVEEGPFVLAEPDPITVDLVLDDELAVTGVVGPDGGTLSAEAADGSTFVLTIPPGALLSNQEITLTPLDGVDGSADGGFAAGVDLAPDGLQLYAVAELVITPAESISPGDEVSAAVHGADHELVLFPLVPAADDATFAITHFSSYYLGAGGLPAIQEILQGTPSRPEDQLLQQIQDLINEERRARILEEDEDPLYRDLLSQYLLSYYKQVLEPHIRAARASKDWRFVCQVIGEVIGFQRTLLLEDIELDIDFDYVSVLHSLLEVEAALLLDYSHQLCSDGLIVQAWTVMLRVARSQDVVGRSFGVDISEWQTTCPPPRLSFSSRMVSKYRSDFDWVRSDTEVEAQVPLRYDAAKRGFVGEAELRMRVHSAISFNGVSGHGADSLCTVMWAPEGAPIVVEQLVVNLNHTECTTLERAEATFATPDLNLELMVGAPSENFTEDCSGVSSHPPAPRDPVDGPARWAPYFRAFHRERFDEERGIYRFSEWDLDVGRVTVFAALEPGCRLLGINAGEGPCPDEEPDFWFFRTEETLAIALHP